MTVRVVIAAPLYNKAEYLPGAIESLLAQTHTDFGLILLDDCSSDETSVLAQRYAEADARVVSIRNPERLGLIDTWRRGYELAKERFPTLEYFAWGSDHDRWHPTWIEALVAELDRHPEAVAAYPRSVRISEADEIIRRPFKFDTAGIANRRTRFCAAYYGMVAGSMVYALFRADTLERAGVFRRVLAPDRLLLAELAYQGEFRQVENVLWERRFKGLHSTQRQRAGSFPHGAPLYSYLPHLVQHVGAVLAAYVVRRNGTVSRPAGTTFAARLATVGLGFHTRRWLKRRRLRFRKALTGRRREPPLTRTEAQAIRRAKDAEKLAWRAEQEKIVRRRTR